MTLFSPLKLGELTLPNRIIMAPLTRCRSIENNCANDMMATYYTQRASAGLIISEATQISKLGIGYPCTPGIHTDAQTESWQKVTSAVHAAGGRIFLQLWHVGRVSHSSYHDDILPVAPSPIAPAGQVYTPGGMKPYETPHALSIKEIEDIKQEYITATKNAIKAGFDGVEVHAANGYLIDQFLRDSTNIRDDIYGGNIENRCRFLFEILDALKEIIAPEKMGVRISPSGTMNDMSDSNPSEHFAYICGRLNEYNLAYLHAVDALEGDIRHGANVVDMGILRKAYDGTLIACGGFDQKKAEQYIEQGLCDGVAFGTLYVSNPDLVERMRANAPLNEGDTKTFYSQGAKGYTDYPRL